MATPTTPCKAAEPIVERLKSGGWQCIRTTGKHDVWQHPNGAIHCVPGTIPDKGHRVKNYLADIGKKEKNPILGQPQSHRAIPKEPEMTPTSTPTAPAKNHVVALDAVVEVEPCFPVASEYLPWFQWVTKVLNHFGKYPVDLPEIMMPFSWSKTCAKRMCRGEKGDGGKFRMTQAEVDHFMCALQIPEDKRPPNGYIPVVSSENPQAKLRLPEGTAIPVEAPRAPKHIVIAPETVDAARSAVAKAAKVPYEPLQPKAPVVAEVPVVVAKATPTSKEAIQAENIAKANDFLAHATSETPILELLRAKRVAKNLSQSQVAQALGTSQPLLSIYERGTRAVSSEFLEKWNLFLFEGTVPVSVPEPSSEPAAPTPPAVLIAPKVVNPTPSREETVKKMDALIRSPRLKDSEAEAILAAASDHALKLIRDDIYRQP